MLARSSSDIIMPEAEAAEGKTPLFRLPGRDGIAIPFSPMAMLGEAGRRFCLLGARISPRHDIRPSLHAPSFLSLEK